MPELITWRMKLKDVFPDRCGELCETFKLKDGEDTEYIRKGLVADGDLQFDDDERAVISHITTNAKDRDSEIVDPAGAILDDYNKHRVVLFGHDHRSLPIGKNAWIKTDKKGLVAKTIYAKHAKA